MLNVYVKRNVFTKNTKHYFYVAAICRNYNIFAQHKTKNITITAHVSKRNKQTGKTVARQSGACAFSKQNGEDRRLLAPGYFTKGS